MDPTPPHRSNRSLVPLTIVGVLAAYFVALLFGWPQEGTLRIVEAQQHHPSTAGDREDADPAASTNNVAAPPLWTVIPFVLLLAAIAVLPLIPATMHWWDSNRNRFLVAAACALVTLAYYTFSHRAPVEGHWPAHHIVEPANGGVQLGFVKTVLENAVLSEFIPFIVLLFSLFAISGGIRITGDLEARPLTNAAFIGVGGILASLIGTTGAAMLLIRPVLETNSERKHVVHTVVFFIFVVCNCGGCLLPIGDPPLFLGYLQGVPFLWTLVLWKEWLFVNGLLLAIYFVLDHFWCYRRETAADIRRDVAQQTPIKICGWQLNVTLLAGVVLAVAFLDPSKALPGTNWHPWMYLREAVQLGLVAVSLWFGSQKVRDDNRFSYHAIVEVAALFSGIFITMQPALQILNVRGDELGIRTPAQFFWATGSLSSVLDNAPTYLVFFKTGQAIPPRPGAKLVAGVEEMTLMGISLGAVFMGAMTYIGNGPNFMVRAIAERAGVAMPSFFGYMVYSCLVLLPLFFFMMWLYLLFPY
jgi:Na+/H+ antiporter NhaD/arsenite permease-like protein